MRTVIAASALTRLLLDTIPFASPDGSLPMLNAVHLRQHGRALTASATDRYALAQSRAHVEPEHDDGIMPGDALLTLSAAKAIAQTFKLERHAISLGATVIIETDDKYQATIRASVPDLLFSDRPHVVMTTRLLDAKFPEIAETIIRPAAPVEALSLDLDYVTRVAKRRRDKHDAPRIVFTGPNRQAIIYLGTADDDTEFRAVIMAMRLPGDRSLTEGWA